MTNVLALPQLTASFIASTNSRIGDAIQFVVSTTDLTPVDITGINFEAVYRPTADDPRVAMRCSTYDGSLINGGVTGTLSWAVPAERTGLDKQPWSAAHLTPGTYVMGLVASADGVVVDLFEKSGPAVVTVSRGVVRPLVGPALFTSAG